MRPHDITPDLVTAIPGAFAEIPRGRERFSGKIFTKNIPFCLWDRELLFVGQDVELTTSLLAILSQPGVWVNCDRCGEEILNDRQLVEAGQILCRSCAGNAYYRRINCGEAVCEPTHLAMLWLEHA